MSSSPPDPKPDLDELRARLEARGLLIRNAEHPLAEDGGDGGAREADATGTTVGYRVPSARVDERDEGGEVWVVCPACSSRQAVPVTRHRYRCHDCSLDWRWAECRSCRALALADEHLEAWPCPACDTYTRSWWQGGSAYDEVRIVSRRRLLAHEREQDRIRQGIRRRSWKLGAALASLVAVVCSAALVIAVSGPPTAEQAAGPPCRAFAELASGLSNGTVARTEVRATITEIRTQAEASTSDLKAAARDLDAHAGATSTPAFQSAAARFRQACDQAGF